MQDANVSDDLQ
jgi:hypothetical protein